MKISVITHGCKLNQYESELIIEQLENTGHTVISVEDESDIFIINSCAVTGEAERKVRQQIRRIRKNFPNSKIILTGCYATKVDEETLQFVDLTLGISEKKQILDFIDKIGVFVRKDFWRDEDISYEFITNSVSDRTRAFVKVQDGCDNSCTYCSIRTFRGTKIRSKPVSVILREIQELVRRNHKEIVITGLNLGKYGIDLGTNLSTLLREIEKIEGNFRIRLSSINPEDITDEFIDVITDYEKFCPHLHIPLQSGSDKILKAMGRKYNVDHVISVAEKLRSKNPLFSLTTDLIVGFPGESEEDFNDTLKLVRNLELLKVHAFRYSDREGTYASQMPGKIPGNVKKDRVEKLIDVAFNVSIEYRNKLIGKTVTVLVEDSRSGIYSGYDQFYIQHEMSSGKIGEFVKSTVISTTYEGVISRNVENSKLVSNE